jgi:hypothetical protein
MGKSNLELGISRSKFIEKAAFDLTQENGSFSLVEVVAACQNSGFGNNIQKIRCDVTHCHEVTALPLKNDLRFLDRKAWFDTAEFLVKLTEFELKNKVFIVGHRLMPFIKESVVWGSFSERETEKILLQKDIKIPLCELTSYYSLYDVYNGMFLDLDEFIGEADWLDIDLPKVGTVSCHDLSSFMSKNKFAPNDYIKIRPKDGLFIKYEIEYCPASVVSSNSAKTLEWRNKFEAGLTQAINYQKQRGGEFWNDDLIAAAFYYGGESLLKNPLGSWFELLHDSDKFSLQYLGGRLFVWDKSSLRNYMHNEFERDETMEFADLEYMGFPELTALMGLRMYECNTLGEMLHIICSGGTLRDARKYCYDVRFAKCPPVLRERFNKMIARIWRRAKRWKNSNTCSPEVMKCRKSMMELKDRILEFIRKLEELDIEPEKLYSEEFAILEKLLVNVYGYFYDFTVYPLDESLEETAEVIPKISSRLETTINQLEKEFMSKLSAVSAFKPE